MIKWQGMSFANLTWEPLSALSEDNRNKVKSFSAYHLTTRVKIRSLV